LIHNPKIILADEPTGALDAATGEAILDILKKVNQMGNTVILVTHDEKIAKKTNRLIVLENSRLVSDTPINICQEEII
jgi:putative ABC transport system ATP-binding protein